MKKTLIIIVLAIISLALIGYMAFTSLSSKNISASEAKEVAQKFISESLLQPGITVTFGEVVEENSLYKLPVTFPDGNKVDTYISKDGQLFFPEGMNIEEVSQQIAAENVVNNQDNTNQVELKTEILTEGSGDKVVKSGDSITVDYTGTLEDGTKFDSSIDAGKPFTFTIGQGTVIQGWDQGLLGMKVGEERKLTIPSDLGYGSTGSGPIPANATLIFTVKLISIN